MVLFLSFFSTQLYELSAEVWSAYGPCFILYGVEPIILASRPVLRLCMLPGRPGVCHELSIFACLTSGFVIASGSEADQFGFCPHFPGQQHS